MALFGDGDDQSPPFQLRPRPLHGVRVDAQLFREPPAGGERLPRSQRARADIFGVFFHDLLVDALFSAEAHTFPAPPLFGLFRPSNLYYLYYLY